MCTRRITRHTQAQKNNATVISPVSYLSWSNPRESSSTVVTMASITVSHRSVLLTYTAILLTSHLSAALLSSPTQFCPVTISNTLVRAPTYRHRPHQNHLFYQSSQDNQDVVLYSDEDDGSIPFKNNPRWHSLSESVKKRIIKEAHERAIANKKKREPASVKKRRKLFL